MTVGRGATREEFDIYYGFDSMTASTRGSVDQMNDRLRGLLVVVAALFAVVSPAASPVAAQTGVPVGKIPQSHC